MIAAALAGGLGLVLLAYLALPRRVRDDPLNPALIVIASVCLLTAGRALYVLDHGAFFLTFETQFALASHEAEFAGAVLAQLLAVALFVGSVAAVARLRPEGGPAPQPRESANRWLLGAGLIGGAAVSLLALALLVGRAGGPGAYLDALRNRQLLFESAGPEFVALSLFAAAVLAWFAAGAAPGRSRRWWAAAAALIVAGSLLALAGGARSPLVFLFLLPLLLVFHARVRPLGWRSVAILALVLFVAVSAFRAVNRDSSAVAGHGLYEPGVAGLLTNTFASPDSRLPDSIAVLDAESVPAKGGATLLGALAAPVPRSLWPRKPRNGNDQLAAALYPESFRPALGLTFAGEATWNFGWAGLLLFVPLGAAVGGAYGAARRHPQDPLRLLLYVGVLGATLVAVRADLFVAVLAFLKAFAPAILLLAAGGWIAAGRPWPRPDPGPPRPTRTALRYLGATLAGRGGVFAALAVAAVVLPVGEYARFALAYQAALFVAYQLAYPFNIASYRLGPDPHPAAVLKRLAVAALAGGAAGGVAAELLLPAPTASLTAATATFAAAASVGVVALGQAQAAGLALTFARWSAAGSVLFLALAGLLRTPAAELMAAAAGMAVAPIALMTRLRTFTAEDGARPIGRPELPVFAAGLLFSGAFVLALVLVNERLAGEAADGVAFLFTLLQAALVVPLQLASLTQPQLVQSSSLALRRAFCDSQRTLSASIALACLAAAGVGAAAGWTQWSQAAPIAFSVLPLGFGLAGGSALLVAAGSRRRLLLGPVVLAGCLALAAAALEPDGASQLALAWAAAAALGGTVQTLALRDEETARRFGAWLLLGAACLAIGYVQPLTATAAALAGLLAQHGALRLSLLRARDLVAAHR